MIVDNAVICAIATAPGTGAIAVIRLGGTGSIDLLSKIFRTSSDILQAPGYTIHFGKIVENERIIDEVLVSLFRAPHSYTGEDSVEISCHGSVYIQQQILQLLLKSGARMAEPGEFTRRAFTNGKLDLSQAEAVADLIASESEAAHRLAIQQVKGGFSKDLNLLRSQLLHFISLIELELDFSEEEVEFADRKKLSDLIGTINAHLQSLTNSFSYGNVMKNGVPVAIVGPPNTGKSTLLNALLNEEKALVSDVAGTTRDVIEDHITLNGINFRFMDTAGIRQTTDKVESMGIERTFEKINLARIVLIMTDATQPEILLNDQLQRLKPSENQNFAIIVNKCDKTGYEQAKQTFEKSGVKYPHFYLSAKHREHIKPLIEFLTSKVAGEQTGNVVVTNARHYEALTIALEAGQRVAEGLQNQLPGDLIAQDIRQMIYYLGTITGEITTDEILGNIFKNFCIGK
jgi:tRNA modification GTPase